MTESKPLRILWSKAAADAAGPRLADLQAQLIAEIADILTSAQGRFLHAFSRDGSGACYLVTGYAAPEIWEILVQTGTFKPMKALSDDHPDPKLRGKVFKMPEAADAPDNDIFALLEDILEASD